MEQTNAAEYPWPFQPPQTSRLLLLEEGLHTITEPIRLGRGSPWDIAAGLGPAATVVEFPNNPKGLPCFEVDAWGNQQFNQNPALRGRGHHIGCEVRNIRCEGGGLKLEGDAVRVANVEIWRSAGIGIEIGTDRFLRESQFENVHVRQCETGWMFGQGEPADKTNNLTLCGCVSSYNTGSQVTVENATRKPMVGIAWFGGLIHGRSLEATQSRALVTIGGKCRHVSFVRTRMIGGTHPAIFEIRGGGGANARPASIHASGSATGRGNTELVLGDRSGLDVSGLALKRIRW